MIQVDCQLVEAVEIRGPSRCRNVWSSVGMIIPWLGSLWWISRFWGLGGSKRRLLCIRTMQSPRSLQSRHILSSFLPFLSETIVEHIPSSSSTTHFPELPLSGWLLRINSRRYFAVQCSRCSVFVFHWVLVIRPKNGILTPENSQYNMKLGILYVQWDSGDVGEFALVTELRGGWACCAAVQLEAWHKECETWAVKC